MPLKIPMAENDGWKLIILFYSICYGFLGLCDQVYAFADELSFT